MSAVSAVAPRARIDVALLDPTLWRGLEQGLREAGLGIAAPGAAARVAVLRSGVVLEGEALTRQWESGVRLVVRSGSGLDNIDLVACRRLGIEVRNIPGANAESVAEVTAALALVLVHRLGEGHHGLVAGRDDKARLLGRNLRDCSVGIIGYGATGRAAARVLRRLGVRRITAWSRSAAAGTSDACVAFGTLAEALGQEIVSLHVAATPETEGLVGPTNAASIARGAMLINMARRRVVDRATIAALLDDGTVAAYASDVMDPVADAGLIARSNVFSSPHLGAHSEATQRELSRRVVDMILHWSADQP